jgi:hypothetical protein
VFPDSQLYRGRNVPLGSTINAVNDIKVKTLSDFRAAIKNCATQKYLTISASDNITRAAEDIFVVLSMEKILEQEPKLSREYRYPITETVKEVMGIAQVNKAVE